jgi:broad specificity phosphatase PhoE
MLLKTFVTFVFAAWLTSAASAATIIVVRHAERSSAMSADANLSPAGVKRAEELSQMLKDAKIQRIYVTEVRRTQQTAAPTAARLHLKPIVVSQKDTGALVGQLRRLGEDETVLVVGHADTVPGIIERLGGSQTPAFRDNEYDRLTVLVTGRGDKAQVVTLRYGDTGQ